MTSIFHSKKKIYVPMYRKSRRPNDQDYYITKMIACKNGDTSSSKFFNQPWIIQRYRTNKNTITFIDLSLVTNVEEKKIGEIKRKICMGCINEWLLLYDKKSKKYFFLNLISLPKFTFLPSQGSTTTSRP